MIFNMFIGIIILDISLYSKCLLGIVRMHHLIGFFFVIFLPIKSIYRMQISFEYETVTRSTEFLSHVYRGRYIRCIKNNTLY